MLIPLCSKLVIFKRWFVGVRLLLGEEILGSIFFQ